VAEGLGVPAEPEGSGAGLLCPAKEEHPAVINAAVSARNVFIYSPRAVRYSSPLNNSLNVPCG
jgi:hypothetical protein